MDEWYRRYPSLIYSWDRIIQYFIIEEGGTIDGAFRVHNFTTEEEIIEMILERVAENISTNRWSVEWEEVKANDLPDIYSRMEVK